MSTSAPLPQSLAVTRARERLLWFALVIGALCGLLGHWLHAPMPHPPTGLAQAFDYLQLSHTTPDRLFIAGVLMAVLVAFVARGRDAMSPTRRRVDLALLFLYAVAAFWAMREATHDEGDGPGIVRDAGWSVEHGRYYTFLDEVGGMWLPLRLAGVLFTHGVESGPAIERGYQLVTIVSGALFVVVVAIASERVRQRHLFATLLLAGATTRLFCGYLENYTTCAVILACLFLYVANDLRSGVAVPTKHILVAAAAASLAVSFHAVAVWCVFGLAYLAVAGPGGGILSRIRVAASAAAVGLLVLGLLYVAYEYWLTPGVSFVHGPKGAAKMLGVIKSRPFTDHVMVIGKVATPAMALIAASTMASPRRIFGLLRAKDVQFALVWALGFAIHQSVWFSSFGLDRDWDLFGYTWLPFAYLGYRFTEVAVARDADVPDYAVVYASFALSLIGGLSWVATAMH